jgi:hypothetical protein
VKDDSNDHITYAFTGFTVMTPSFTHLSITFSNRRFSSCSPTVDVGFLTSDSFCGNRVFKMNTYLVLLSCYLCYSGVIFREKEILLNVRRSLSVNVDLCPLFLFADVVFPWFVYADITSETVPLNTPNNVAVFITDDPTKRAPIICGLLKWDKSPIFRFFHMDSQSTQSLMHWYEHYKL